MIEILNRVKNFFPSKLDDQDTRYFKITSFLIVGLFGLMIFVGFIVFFVNLEGKEKIKVPNVTTTELTKFDILDGIMKLQEKFLNVKIQEKHSSEYARGTILEQDPKPGAVVKAGRPVTLIVSKGPVINKIEDYTSKTIGWLRYELRSKFASGDKALIEIREPVIYEYDESPQGTILEQNPKPGTPIYENKVTYINLIVSKGPKGKAILAEDYKGQSYSRVIKNLASKNVQFTFDVSTNPNLRDTREGIVIAQDPEKDQEITHLVPVRLTITPVVTLGEDEVFGIFQYIVEKYPIPVDIVINALYEDNVTTLLSMKHEGGKIAFPYVLKTGTEIVVYILDAEVDRFLIESDKTNPNIPVIEAEDEG